jgi:hypothetical protein
MGFASPASPNDPNKDGAGDPADVSPVAYTGVESSIPSSSNGSFTVSASGKGYIRNTDGQCQSVEDDCQQLKSCEFEAYSSSGVGRLAITITSSQPSGGGQTGPIVSSNWTQDPGGALEWELELEEGDPVSPSCGGEVRWVVCWNGAGGTPQRWELSFSCKSCTMSGGGV